MAGYVAAGSGLLALITIALFFAVGQPFGTLNDLSLLVMTLAIAPIMLGFYELGAAGPATLAGETSIGGRGLVVNPSGGLVSRGHPIGATGVCQVVEIAQQLRGDARGRQVEGARLGATVNTGGIISRDVACVGVHILASGF